MPSAAAFLDAVLTRYAGDPRMVTVTVPAPVVPLPTVFGLLDDPSAFLWEPPEGPGYAAFGEAWSVTPEGADRGTQVRALAEQVGARMEAVYHPAVPPARPRWFGGLAFAPGGASAAPWSGFGDGRFVLPRWSYGRDGERAWLTFAIDGGGLDAEGRARASAELRRWIPQLEARVGRWPEPGPAREAALRVEHLDEEAWGVQVNAIREVIDAGRLDKVVAARRSMIDTGEEIAPALVLTRLGRDYPGCTRFAVRMGGATFVGATPEWLVRRSGRRVRSEAMAGSVAHGASAALLTSEKDRREHDLVVRTLIERLEPHCASLERAPEPHVRELPNVVHLHTPVVGELRRPTHVLELVDTLHPTPAVGGVPVEAAVDWIAKHEPHARGWYSAPIGWFDADGDGEFIVALRSGLVRGHRAWAYAGAGIVRGSEPDAEYAETDLKLRPLLEALGQARPRVGEGVP